jgi:hypothetical protein
VVAAQAYPRSCADSLIVPVGPGFETELVRRACRATHAWTEFVSRNLYGNYAKGFAEVDSSVSESEADSGTVRLETKGERLVEVSVELQYMPHAGSDAGDGIARAQARLDHDLERFRAFLLRRCEQESCRAA